MKRQYELRYPRLRAVILIFLAFFLVIVGKLVYILVVHGEEYAQAAADQQVFTSESTLAAARGTIVDRNENILAETMISYDVIIDPAVLHHLRDGGEIDNADEVIDNSFRELARILKMKDVSYFSRFLDEEYKDSRYERFSEGRSLSGTLRDQIQAGIDSGEIVGVWLENVYERNYPFSELAAHVIGFNEDYGIEKQYREYLTGQEGLKQVVTYPDGHQESAVVPARNGDTVYSTLDMTMDYYLERVLIRVMKEHNCKHATGILIDPENGEIFGSAVYPTFDLNDVESVIGLSSYYKQAIRSGEDFLPSVWENQALTQSYQPGSTYKPIFSSCALDSGCISLTDEYECNATYQYYDQVFKCAYYEAHGIQTIRDVIAHSCNCGMVQVSQQVPIETYLAYQRAFGIGQLTGIDLPDESSFASLVYDLDSMGPVELATTAFGQGFNVTPMQLLRAECAVVNNGSLITPHVVSHVIDADGKVTYEADTAPVRQVISAETSQRIREGMEEMVSEKLEGTALEGIRIGGKTGTAQQGVYEEEKYAVSFVGFAPIEDPKIGILIVLDEADTNSSSTAMEAALEVLEDVLPYMNIYPD